VLPEILPAAILGLSFPKSMYWTTKSDPRFVRPIRWVLAVLGEGKQAQTVDFEILGVKSGDFTFGHRVLGKGKKNVKGFSDYEAKLRRGCVGFDPEKRRQTVRAEAKVLLEDSLKLIEDPELEEWIVNSTEWPTGILGTFDILYQALPREILITVMRDHQKYFAVEDGQGNLRPHFVAVLNMDADEMGLIRQGHERVLQARFRDAEFFWNADQRTPLSGRLPLLEKVTYQAELGTYGDKVRRMEAIAKEICRTLEGQGKVTAPDTAHALRAVRLCKCDLTTQMVQEFPELQGIVGGLYAAPGEPKETADAIYDHYLPQGAEDRCPRSLVGAVVSLADKFDSVVTGFAVGHEPTGSSDPFAIRRQAAAIIKVILEYSLPISLEKAVNQALDAFEFWQTSTVLAGAFGAPGVSQAQQAFAAEWSARRQKVRSAVLEFLADRLRYYLESVRGFRYDTVRAVLAAGSDVPGDGLARAEALEGLRGKEDLEVLCTAAKRIRNILVKSATAADWQPGEVGEALLKEPEERELYNIYAKVAAEAGRRRESYDYRGALEEISTLRTAVDRFFDAVLVMTEDRETRQNRLRLLKKLDELFSGIAHFADIERR
jgi:glycyl-tRNA synthetase beta chain